MEVGAASPAPTNSWMKQQNSCQKSADSFGNTCIDFDNGNNKKRLKWLRRWITEKFLQNLFFATVFLSLVLDVPPESFWPSVLSRSKTEYKDDDDARGLHPIGKLSTLPELVLPVVV